MGKVTTAIKVMRANPGHGLFMRWCRAKEVAEAGMRVAGERARDEDCYSCVPEVGSLARWLFQTCRCQMSPERQLGVHGPGR